VEDKDTEFLIYSIKKNKQYNKNVKNILFSTIIYMSDYLFTLNTPNISNPSPYDNSLPQNDCTNGNPISQYSNYGSSNSDVLYSIWSANQNTLGAQFTANQNTALAPGFNPSCQGPANIFIIRHGEKSPTLPNYSLDNNGIYRACQLPNFINLLAKDGYPISYIVTCNPCPFNTSDPSMREFQTISMASFMLNIPMYVYGGAQDFSGVCDALFPYPVGSSEIGQFDGLNIIICWEHSAIQSLCLSLLQTMGPLNRLDVSPINYNNITNYADPFFTLKNPCNDGNYLCNDPTSVFYINNIIPPSTAPIGPNSQTYPYWNNYNFDNVYWFKSNGANYKFDFKIFNEPCYTCFPSCGLNIGLYQPLKTNCVSSNYYYANDPSSQNLEDSCLVPIDWTV